MVISCRFPLSFDAIMQNYTVYDGLTNWNFAKKTTWRPARSITLTARSANCLRVAAKTRTKRDPPPCGQWGNMLAARIFYLFNRRRPRKHGVWSSSLNFTQDTPVYSRNKPPTLLSWSIYISIRFMLTMPFPSRSTGGFFVSFFQKPVPAIMESSLQK